MINTERLNSITHFLETIDQFKMIYRATYIQDRHENDAEHTWHMAMFALLLHKELSVTVDIEQALKLILTHDLVEIYAGDTPIFDAIGQLDKKEREEQAAQRLFALLPTDLQSLIYGWWQEFEENRTPEARFAHALDRLQAFAQNVSARGRVWREHGVTQAQSRTRNQQAMDFDPALKHIFEMFYQRAEQEELWPA